MKRTTGVCLALMTVFALGVGCQDKSDYLELGGTIERSALLGDAVGFEELRNASEGAELVLTGTIGKVCPAGCWFYLHGDSDMVYVDVLGDYEVPQEASGRESWVRGKVSGDGGARILQGVRVLVAPPK
jgi:hypothetical protein